MPPRAYHSYNAAIDKPTATIFGVVLLLLAFLLPSLSFLVLVLGSWLLFLMPLFPSLSLSYWCARIYPLCTLPRSNANFDRPHHPLSFNASSFLARAHYLPALLRLFCLGTRWLHAIAHAPVHCRLVIHSFAQLVVCAPHSLARLLATAYSLLAILERQETF